MDKEDHFAWWMPTYVTLLIMGLSILAMFSIDENTAQSMLSDSGVAQILTAATLIAICIFCLQRAFRKIPPPSSGGN